MMNSRIPSVWRSIRELAWASGGPPRYRSLCVGHQRLQDDFPPRLLTSDAAARVAGAAVGGDETLTELGVYVFVAQRR